MPKTPILIAGPTASGKSHAALELARRLGGAIINTDSMQVYEGLRVLTARPSAEEEAQAPHHLYGVVDAAERCSAGRWARMAGDVLARVLEKGERPIFVGGTGLYFRALTEGLSAIPDIPPEVRDRAEARIEEAGIAALYADILKKDSQTASGLRSSDSQRIQRAWEVFEATGRGLVAWQGERKTPVLSGPSLRLVLEPPRDWLYARCDQRFDRMLEQGAVEEVEALMKRQLDPTLPAMKALGVREIASCLAGKIGHEEAREEAKKLTRRYAKRQLTWMRNQMTDWTRIDPADASGLARALAEIG